MSPDATRLVLGVAGIYFLVAFLGDWVRWACARIRWARARPPEE